MGNISGDGNNKGGIIGYINSDNGYNTTNINNCFNVGMVVEGTRNGSIYGTLRDSNLNVSNIYYVEYTNSKIGYSLGGYINEIQSKYGTSDYSSAKCISNEEIKMQDFIDLLNNNLESNSGWLKWKKGINGYPIFE